jgi:hypothetical protein
MCTRPVVKFFGVLPVALKLRNIGLVIACVVLCICILCAIAPVVAGQCSDSCDQPSNPPTSKPPSKTPDWVTDIFDQPPLPPIITPPMITPDPTPDSEAPPPSTTGPPLMPAPTDTPPSCGEDIPVIPYQPPYILPPPPVIGPVQEPEPANPFESEPIIPYNELDFQDNPDPYNRDHPFVRGTHWLVENTIWLGDKYVSINVPAYGIVKRVMQIDNLEFSLDNIVKEVILKFLADDWWEYVDAGFEFAYGEDWFDNVLSLPEGHRDDQLRNYPAPPPVGDPFNPQP